MGILFINSWHYLPGEWRVFQTRNLLFRYLNLIKENGNLIKKIIILVIPNPMS